MNSWRFPILRVFLLPFDNQAFFPNLGPLASLGCPPAGPPPSIDFEETEKRASSKVFGALSSSPPLFLFVKTSFVEALGSPWFSP